MNIQSYKLPDGWNMRAIGDAYRFTKKPKGLRIEDVGEIPFIPMELLPLGKVFVDDCVMKPTAGVGSGTYFENGDLLVAKITPSFENGKQAVARINAPFGYATTEVIPIQEIEGTSDKLYLHFALLHPEIRRELAEKMDGTTGRQRLRKEIIASKQIPLPPLPEQRSIAHVLSTVLTTIQLQARLIALARELQSGMMNKLCAEGLGGEKQKETDIGRVPESWTVETVGENSEVKGGKRLPKGAKVIDQKTDFPYVRVTDFADYSVDLSRLKYLLPATRERIKRYTITDRDVFISIAGTIGLAGIVPPELNGANLTENAAKIVLKGTRVSPRFLMYFLSTETAQREIRSQTVKNAQPKLALARIESLRIPIPLLDEQEEIARALDTLREKALLHQRKKEMIEELFRTLLHRLLTGQIRVNQINLPGRS